MLVSNGILTHKYEQRHQPGMYLGRHLELDGRSLPYTVSDEEIKTSIKPARWEAPIPILNQGNLGSCTGNAGTRMISFLHKDNLQTVQLAKIVLSTSDATEDENFAVELYHEATINDGFQGVYPPNDTGSSGLGVCRSLKKAKLIGSYVHGLNLRGMATLLQKGPNIIGMPWLKAFFEPDKDGFIDADPNWQSSPVEGGHEIYEGELEAWDDNDPRKCIFVFDNSWDTTWGDSGHFRMRGSTYEFLKTQMDVIQARV